MLLQEILNLRIGKGAIYEQKKVLMLLPWEDIKFELVSEWEEEWEVIRFSPADLSTVSYVSFYKILYWDNNFWEVIIDCPAHNVCSECWLYWCDKKTKTTIRNYDYYKMQSTLHKDKVKYISDLLSNEK